MENAMRKKDFFQEIEHLEFQWGDQVIHLPIYYYDLGLMSVQFLASMQAVKHMLPSKRMHPYRITPNQCLVAITALEYRDCDIGPYNEVSIGVPFTLDRPTPYFTGILRRPPAKSLRYILHLPVTT
jgi:hypothetical protein